MNAVVELGRVVAKLDEPLVKRRADTIRETVGPRPEQPNRRTMLVRSAPRLLTASSEPRWTCSLPHS